MDLLDEGWSPALGFCILENGRAFEIKFKNPRVSHTRNIASHVSDPADSVRVDELVRLRGLNK